MKGLLRVPTYFKYEFIIYRYNDTLGAIFSNIFIDRVYTNTSVHLTF